MAYLTFDALEQHNAVVQESIATMGRQLWDGIKQAFNMENWTSNDANNANYLKAKRKYFNELFTITPKLKAKLLQWVKNIPGALALPPGELSQMLSASNVEQRQRYTHYHVPDSGYSYGTSQTYDAHERNELTLQRKARVNNARNSVTYATCSYILDAGGKAYLLMFTFDSDGIDVCQVLTQNKYSSGGMSAGYDFAKVPQWSSVSKEEYMKE